MVYYNASFELDGEALVNDTMVTATTPGVTLHAKLLWSASGDK